MRGRKRIISFVALLSVVLIVSAGLASGVVDVSNLSLLGAGTVEPLSPGLTVSMDPRKIIDKTKQAGSLVTFDVNVTEATNLFTWQINVTWSLDTVKGYAMLNVNTILARDFLGATKDTSSEVLGRVINVTNNAQRYSAMAETVLGDVTGVTGNGDLVRIEFLVLNYGTVDITIIVSGGTLPTKLLNSAGTSLIFAKFDGVFRNILPGDTNHDKKSDFTDFNNFVASYFKTSGVSGYNREADTDIDGKVDFTDFNNFVANYFKTIP